MRTLHGIRFLQVARFDGMLLGLDARWLGVRGFGLIALLMLATPAGPLSQDAGVPMWLRLCIGLSTVAAVVLTSLGHELGHVLAGRLAGLRVRAVVLAPEGGLTIRAGSDRPGVNFCTAMAGPLANAVLGTLCLWLTVAAGLDSPLRSFLIEFAALHFVTAMVNLLPCGPLDGRRIFAAWRALQTTPLVGMTLSHDTALSG
jgi:Zn-dependent protease